MDTLRNQLRSATAAQHERVDAAFSAYRLDQPEGYRAFLQAHAQVLIPLEIELEQAGIETMLDDWPLRCRRQALLADLKALGCAEPPLTPAGMAPSPGWSWGAAYVIEGSRLGGRVLARRCRRQSVCPATLSEPWQRDATVAKFSTEARTAGLGM